MRSNFPAATDWKRLPSTIDTLSIPFSRAFMEAKSRATGTPIVSTNVEDVVLQFGEIVCIATDHEEFIAGCEESIARPNASRVQAGMNMRDKIRGK